MNTVLFVMLGVVIGVVALIIIAHIAAKKDEAKYDTTKQPYVVRGYWPEGYTSDPVYVEHSSLWKSSTTTLVTFDEPKKNKNKKVSLSLEDQLQNAVEIEDYETAAKLRDKINKSKK